MLNEFIKEINLASQSPARLEILKSQGLKVNVFPTDSNEAHSETKPEKVVELLALRKLNSYISSVNFNPNIPAVACDTLIWFKGNLIGKAHSKEEAFNQIKEFSGNTHKVFSGYALYINGKTISGFDVSEVNFREIDENELNEYIESEEWKGAAGSYHIQGKAAGFISYIKGDINTVIGLPLSKVSDIIKSLC